MEEDVGGGLYNGGGCQRGISTWRQMLGVGFNMEADVRGKFQYGGRCRGQILIWSQMSEAIVLLRHISRRMLGADLLI
jgi:hypothetical protein